jgi:hypothetical protein
MPRGGARPGSGRKPKPFADKIAAGNPGHRPLKKLDFALNGENIQPPEYLSLMDKQIPGITPPVKIFTDTVETLRPSGCLGLIPAELLAEYVVAKHYLLCAQYALSTTALVTLNERDEPVATAFTDVMLKMQKNCSACWLPIWTIVQRNAERQITDPEEELMAQIIGARQQTRKE